MGREDINLVGGWRDEGGVESLVNSPKDTLDFFFFLNKQQTVKLLSDQSA